MPKILPKINNILLNKKFISISKAAKFLQVSPDTLRNWERQGKLLPSRTYGGARRYSTTELLNLKKQLRPFANRKRGLVSVSAVAKALRVSPDTIRNWDKKGLIESSRSKGGARRFTRDEIRRLQKELGVEVCEQEILPESLKSSHEVHNFTTAWLKITFPIVLIMLILVIGWFLGSYVAPLEKRLDDTSKLVTEIIQSIEALQKGVLGIQSQPEPSPIILPSNLNTYYVSSGSGIVISSVSEPVTLDISTGQIGCASCLTTSSSYVSSLINSDGTLSISLTDKTATVSLNLDHANGWSAPQVFNNSVGIGTVVVTSNGNVGIGWTSPINKLEVAGAQTIGSGYAGVYTAPVNGLIVQGNVGIGTSLPSYHLDVAGGARFACGSDTWSSGPVTDCSDIAEVYESDGDIDIGEIVVATQKPNIVTKSSVPYQQGIVGIYSTSPGLLVGGQVVLAGRGSLTGNQIPVALAGRVLVKVSDENGSVQAGDFLTSSSIPGVAMKATKIGLVIGQALEPFDVLTDELLSSTSADTHLINLKAKIKKILVFVNPSFADPNNFLASLSMDDQGNLIIPKLKVGSIILDPVIASGSGQQLTANSSSVILRESSTEGSSMIGEDSSLIAQNDKMYYDLTGKIASLESRIQNSELRIKELETKIAGVQTATSSADLAAQSTSEEPVPVTSEVSTASSSAQNTSGVGFDSPEVSELNLTPPDVLLASNISKVSFGSFEVSEATVSGMLTAYQAQIQDNFKVLGKTTLADTLVAGNLTVDGTLSFTGNSINAIGLNTSCSKDTPDVSNSTSGVDGCNGILYLQNSPLAYQVDFFNGLVTIDKLGNLRAQVVTVAEFRTVGGKISGSAKINAGTKSVDIDNSLVKPSSRILITPTSETDLVLAVTDKTEGKKFTVTTAQTVAKDIVFDWFLINETSE